MRILWVVAQTLPEVAEHLGQRRSNFGGWVKSMLSELKKEDSIVLAVVSCNAAVKKIESFKTDNIEYWILPIIGKNLDVSIEDCREVIDKFKPDIIHIEGTERSISKRFSEQKDVINLVSLQGIINGYEPYQFGDLPVAELMFSIKPRNWVVGWTLFLRKRILFNYRLAIERDTISNADNIMGRTLWDRAHSYVYNHSAPYYKCNRTLRTSFYNKCWEYDKCNKYTIFVGNGYSALKGGHFAIEALMLLIDEFPNTQLIFAGEDPYIHSHKELKKYVGYSYYLRGLIKNPKIKGHVHYIGSQNEAEMVNQLLSANVYVLPSLIENSPNTLGEAMIMGVPCVSAYTGGAGEMAIDEKEALLYRAGDAAMMAWQIKRIFDFNSSIQEMCNNARLHAGKTHNPQKNVADLLDVYREICRKEK